MPRNTLAPYFLMTMAFLVIMVAVMVWAVKFENARVWHVTCPLGVYTGDVRHTIGGWVEIESGHNIPSPYLRVD